MDGMQKTLTELVAFLKAKPQPHGFTEVKPELADEVVSVLVS